MDTKELFPLASERSESKNLQRIISQYAKYWYLFLVSIILCIGAAYTYLKYYAVPLYASSSSLLIKEEESNSPMVEGAFNMDVFAASKNLNNEIEVLKSEGLMQRVATELDLTTTYHVEGRFRNFELYGKDAPVRVIMSRADSTIDNKDIFIQLKKNNSYQLQEREDGPITTHLLGQLIHEPYGNFTIVAGNNVLDVSKYQDKTIIIGFHNIKSIANNFRSNIQIIPINKDATVLKISMVDALPHRSRDVINKLVEVYDKEALENKNLTAANTIHFLDDRLKFITDELTGVEKDVERYKSQNEVTDVNTQASNYVEQASDYNKKLSEWAIQIDVLESIENYLNKSTGQHKLVPSTLGIQDQTLLGLIGKFNELQLERERMLRTTELGNPLVQNIDEQLGNLQINILENLRNIKRGLVITSNSIRASSGQFKSKIQKVPSVERELLEINRQQETKQKLYLYLLQKREEAGLSLAATVSNSRIIDSAISSDYPISPSKQIIYLAAILAGLVIPFTGVYTKELLNDKIQDQLDVERLTATPILGELAHNNQGTLVMTRGNSSPLAEMFRLIRTNLYFAAAGTDNRVILVTSSMSGEGKTFFSINLGATLALTGKCVVILELDLRQPNLLQSLDIKQGIGVTDYVTSNHIALYDIIQPVKNTSGLFVIGAGTLPSDPAELMMSQKLGYLLNELRENFDHIIVDTAPIGKVADAFNLRSYVNQTVYIVRYNYTLKRQIDIIANIFRNKTLANPMIVLNDAKKDNEYGYGYGYEKKKEKLFSRSFN